MRLRPCLGTLCLLFALPACMHSSQHKPTEAMLPPLPSNASPAPEIAGLAFLTGQWTAINPNKTVNEETWTAPRGNVLIGSFRQVRLDGDCSFVEMSQIALENGEVILRLRHLHGRMEVPKGREDVSLFELVSLDANRVEFRGVGETKDVVSVVYERVSPSELHQSLGFSPESGQAPFVTHYRLDNLRKKPLRK